MARKYKCLTKIEFSLADYRLVPIRDEDKFAIQTWRNEQIDILRQKEPLTAQQQETYFRNVVDKLFDDEQPSQILFSFVKKTELIGYGGLVHIDWDARNAEVSFVNATERITDPTFSSDFTSYLRIISDVAFSDLHFYKLHTTVYDLPARRSYLRVIEECGFVREGHLKGHHLHKNQLVDVLVYSHQNPNPVEA